MALVQIAPGGTLSMEVLLTSTALVAFAEIGDKTMLLAIVLAARFKRHWAVLAGIFVATLANHALAAWAGSAVAGLLASRGFQIAVACGFIAMAAWTLVPDRYDDDADADKPSRYGPFLTTLIAFFIVEMGDKTQIATIALGARYQDVMMVAAGTTLGMMLANTPAVFGGEAITRVVPLKWVRAAAALIFLVLGLWTLIEAMGRP